MGIVNNSRMHISRAIALTGIAVTATFLVGCGAENPDSSIATVPPNGETLTIQVLDNSFRPVEYEITAGTEIIFDNRGRNDHNILPDSVQDDAGLAALLSSDSSPQAWGVVSTELIPGTTYSHLFNAPGVYKFYCSIHGVAGAGMYGTLTVS